MLKSLLISAVLAVFSTTAMAQIVCQAHSHDSAVKLLENKYKESEVAFGVVTNKLIAEVLATNTGSTWTILLTGTDGGTCMLAAGKNLVAGNLGEFQNYFTTEGYTNLVAIGEFDNDRRKLVVIVNENFDWKMIALGTSGMGWPMLEGEGWRIKLTLTDPEA